MRWPTRPACPAGTAASTSRAVTSRVGRSALSPASTSGRPHRNTSKARPDPHIRPPGSPRGGPGGHVSGSGLQVVGDRAQHGGDLAGGGPVGVAPAVQGVGHPVQQLDQVLDDDRQLVRRLALSLGQRRDRVQHPDGQRLLAAPALGHAELHPRAGLELGDPGRQRITVHEHVVTVVPREEAEALLRAEPLHLASRHEPSVLQRCAPRPALMVTRLVARCSRPPASLAARDRATTDRYGAQRYRSSRVALSEPDRNPSGSSVTGPNPSTTASRSGRSATAGTSSRSTSTLAPASPRSRTRRSRTGSPAAASAARSAASARSTRASRLGVTSTPYAMRLDRQAAAGLSQVESPISREAARTSALVRPASASGVTAPRSAAARIPGRNPARRSSALVPVATWARPSRSATGPSTSSSSALQKKHRSPALAR